ncbi:MAG: phosphatidate cytidylyltransferase [Myxococcota bacterium]
MSSLAARVRTSLVLVPLLIMWLWWGTWVGFWILGGLALSLALVELVGIYLPQETWSTRALAMGLTWMLFVGFLGGQRQVRKLGTVVMPDMTFWIAMTLMILMLWFLFARGGRDDVLSHPARDMASLFFLLMYVGLLGGHVLMLSCLPEAAPARNRWVFLALVVTFVGDTLAYAFGRVLGGPKLYPRVSPNKTWAGLLGCMCGGVLGAFVVHGLLLPELLWWDCLILGVGCAVLGQSGDFCESMIKRGFEVKDSGALLPGHGGMMDRIDALLFNGPFLYYYTVWVILARGTS